MGISPRLAAIAMAAGAWLSVAPIESADASLTLSMRFDTHDLSVPTLSGSNGMFSFGGNNSYAVYKIEKVRGVTSIVYEGLQASAASLAQGRIAIQIRITNDAPGDPSGAELFNVTQDVRSNGGGEGNSTLVITARESYFTAPTGNVTLGSQFGWTTNNGGNASFRSQLLNSGGTVLASADGTNSVDYDNLTGPFQLQNVTTFEGFNANRTFTSDGRTSLNPRTVPDAGAVAAVPEPSTMALASVALGLLSVRYARQRIKGRSRKS